MSTWYRIAYTYNTTVQTKQNVQYIIPKAKVIKNITCSNNNEHFILLHQCNCYQQIEDMDRRSNACETLVYVKVTQLHVRDDDDEF